MIAYSPETALAQAHLKQKYNDVDIFVEDIASITIWNTIIKKILPKRIKFSGVHALGGRENVVHACSLSQSMLKKRHLFIIDGDLDVLVGKPAPSLNNLYRIDSYCMENILLTEETLL
jgi:hypothetical protein